ncbi:hypothetical protein HMPREF3293_00421 [Christensenella minuta]|uniref:Uncharacterized protein n=1 Tax=Christensenella minuta TaxID=626937 RepID=A0A136Q7U3_9FIRM|nr:hypothetical protein HMPREF3293_00421 [Christensenella minuta]
MRNTISSAHDLLLKSVVLRGADYPACNAAQDGLLFIFPLDIPGAVPAKFFHSSLFSSG